MFRRIFAVLVAVLLVGTGAAVGQSVNQTLFLAGGQSGTVRCATQGETWNKTGFPLVAHCPPGPPLPTTTTTQATTTTTTAPNGELTTPASYFGDDVTNDQVTSWAVASNSQTAVNTLLGVGTGNSINTWLNEDRPIEIVPPNQPEVLMAEGTPTNGRNWCGTDFTDDSLSNPAAPPAGNYNSLLEAPIPSGVYYSNASTDDEVAILRTSNPPQEYDFWLFGEGGTPSGSGNQTFPGQIIDPFYSSGSPNPDAPAWDFGDGGQLNTTNNPPVFTQVGCGVSAAGLSLIATDISEQDVYDATHYPAQTGGGIDHALALEIPWQLCNGFVWPANRADCSGPGTNLAEGQYFRLGSPSDCTPLQGNGSPPIAFMVCYALAHYGMIVQDRNTENPGAIILEGEDPVDWTAQGYSGPDPYTTAMGSEGQGALASVPWSDLRLVTPPSGTKGRQGLVAPGSSGFGRVGVPRGTGKTR